MIEVTICGQESKKCKKALRASFQDKSYKYDNKSMNAHNWDSLSNAFCLDRII